MAKCKHDWFFYSVPGWTSQDYVNGKYWPVNHPPYDKARCKKCFIEEDPERLKSISKMSITK